MKIDMHCHAWGCGKDIANADNEAFYLIGNNSHWFVNSVFSYIQRNVSSFLPNNKKDCFTTDDFFEFFYWALSTSKEIDAVVVLALDAPFSANNGALMSNICEFWVPNKFTINRIKTMNYNLRINRINKSVYYGASVNPNRRDWIEEFDYALETGSPVLFKLVPSAQHIDLTDKRYVKFYKKLSDNNMPLLCHTGPEYALTEGIKHMERDEFEKLRLPLECGVTVIAAHCAAPVFPTDVNRVGEFCRFMEWADREGLKLYADTSNLSLSTRMHVISEILTGIPSNRMLHGSDFPIPVESTPIMPSPFNNITLTDYLQILATSNPLDRDVVIKRAHGFSDATLSTALKVLNLPDK
ncbi:MAG: amidohydrolase family protein [Nitrospirae bacterium YQR-1]